MGRLVGRRVVFLLVIAAVTSGGSAVAQQRSPHSWNDLSPEQQGLVREHYERFRQLPQPERQNVEQMYRRWQHLPPAQQQRLRDNYERYLKLDPAQREQFDVEYRRWKSHRRVEGSAGAQ